jgi:hypothetical protein
MSGKLGYVERRRRTVWLLVAAALAGLLLTGCADLDGALEAELPHDGPPPTTSAASAGRFLEKAAIAGEGAAGTGRFTLTVTDEEVTSFLSIGSILRRQLGALPLEDFGQIADIPELEGIDPDNWQELLGERDQLLTLGDDGARLRLTIVDPSVYFLGNGQIIVRGSAQFLILRVPARVVTAPRASQGELVLDFVEGQLGPVAMPEIIFDYLGKGLVQALLAGREYAEITEIRVGDGVLTITGRWTRQGSIGTIPPPHIRSAGEGRSRRNLTRSDKLLNTSQEISESCQNSGTRGSFFSPIPAKRSANDQETVCVVRYDCISS